MSSEELTFTSPLSVVNDVLRRFDEGGVEGGAVAALAFFLPRGISGMFWGAQHNLDCRDPILWNGGFVKGVRRRECFRLEILK